MFKFKFPNTKGPKEVNAIEHGTPDRSSIDKNKEAFQTGMDIANLITYFWNSQKTPGKVYVSNRRVHHGEIGSLLALSNLFKKSQPIPAGILSGLGEGLVKDDYADKDVWFTFKKKDAPQSSKIHKVDLNNKKKE
jgi:hypothetical protein